MDLSIVIVNWNSAAYVEACVRSIYRQTQGVEFEVVVVNNGSCDGALAEVLAQYPLVRCIDTTVNLGFAAANNLGVKHCSGRNVLFLNPDTEVIGTALREMVLFLDRTADAAIAGPTLLNSDLSVQTSCVQRFPSLVSLALDSALLRRMLPYSQLWGVQPILDAEETVSAEVISGASLMCKAEIFEEMGGFDTDYFMYTEDVDLCYTANQLGWKCYYVGAAHVIHHGGSSSKKREEDHFAAIVMRESLFRFLTCRRGRIYATVSRWTLAVVDSVRLCVVTVLMIGSRGSRRTALRISKNKWVRLLRWTFGCEAWVTNLRPQRAEQAMHTATQDALMSYARMERGAASDVRHLR